MICFGSILQQAQILPYNYIIENMLRHITRPFLNIKSQLRNTSIQQRQAASQQTTRKWLQKLIQLSTTAQSKSSVGQLTSVVNFLNRKVDDQNKVIDWKAWNEKIITTGLVDKVQASHAELSKQEYDLDGIINKVLKGQSKALQQIGRQMDFHTALWIDNYLDYVIFLFELQQFPGTSNMLPHETFDWFAGLEAKGEQLVETHNYIPGSKDQVNLLGYMRAQFAWGKKVISFYRHPCDDFKCLRSTKNVLGR